MKRLTTDTPDGNFDTALNFVYGKDGWAYIRHDGEHENVLLTDWAKRQCLLHGCDEVFAETAEEIDQRLCDCMMDAPICPIALAYCFASQAVHLRSRLAAYEDTGLGPDEITTEPYGCAFYCNRKCNLDGDWCVEGPGCQQELNADTAKHLLELAQAEKDGRLVVLPPNDPLTLAQLRDMGNDWVWIKLLAPLYRMESGYYMKHEKLSSREKICCGYPGVVVRELLYAGYGRDWIAYRRKPEEGTTA